MSLWNNFIRYWLAPLLLVLIGVVFVILGLRPVSTEVAVVLPTMTAEPIVPTRTPAGLLPPPTMTPRPVLSPTPRVVPTITPAATSVIDPQSRFGVTVQEGQYFQPAVDAGLKFHSYLNWHLDVYLSQQVENYWPMIRLSEGGLKQDSWDEIAEVVKARPGIIWLIGNEPDVQWQDNVTPEKYAEHYHNLYYFIKELDPTAQIAVGGISQPTPLRLAYLERMLTAYKTKYGETLPTEVWNVHAFILREEEGSWGVGIPPGMDEKTGMLYEIEDHADLEIFRQNMIKFREWMAEQGYADKPVVVTEYGILMPPDYGFGPEVAAEFLAGTLEFFTTAADPEIGYPADNGRLVQWWFWYGVYENPERYPAGNLYDPATGELTPAGELFSTFPRS